MRPSFPRCRFFALLWACFACVSFAAPAAAHPADEILERDYVHLRPDGAEIEMTISAGVIKLYKVWGDADTDGDNRLTAAEREAFGAMLAAGYDATLDGATAPVQYVPGSLAMADTRDAFSREGAGPDGALVRALFRLPYDATRPHTLTLNVNHYNAYAGGSDGAARPPELYPDAAGVGVVAQGPNAQYDLQLATAPLGAAVSAPAMPVASPPAPRSPNIGQASWLTNLLLTSDGGPGYALAGVFVAVLLGALHALTPGHGKTMVAAYLVGGRGRVRDAVLLGGVVTITHTGSVILLGVLTLLFTRFVVPDRVIPWLEMVSALAILALGAALLIGQLRSLPRRPRRVAAPSSASTPAFALAATGPAPGDTAPASGWHDHDDGTEHAHGFFGAHAHTHAPMDAARLSPRALVLMGMSGGLVPCPDALAILLVAVAAGKLLLGLAVLLAFSLGLAAVLIALGVAIASTRLLARGPLRGAGSSRWAGYIPALSAAVVVLVGGAMLLRAVIAIAT